MANNKELKKKEKETVTVINSEKNLILRKANPKHNRLNIRCTGMFRRSCSTYVTYHFSHVSTKQGD